MLRTAILLLSISFACSANGEIILNPRGTLVTQRILNYKDYDDIRIDRDLDGKVDEWYLRKGDTEIQVRYNQGQISTVKFKVFSGPNVKVKEYSFLDNRMILTNSEDRPMLVMHGEAENDACETQQQALNDKISVLNGDISAILANTGGDKKSCDLTKFPKFSKRLLILLRDISKNPTKYTSCIADQSLENVDAKLVSARLTLAMEKMRANPSSTDNVFTCGYIDGENARGTTTEDGKIRLDFPKNGDDPPVSLVQMYRLVFHELTHSAGVTNEDSINELVNTCMDIDGVPRSSYYKPPTVNNMVPQMKGHVERAANNLSNKSANTKEDAKEVNKPAGKRSPANVANTKSGSISMRTEIANAKAIVPSAEKLSIAKSDKSPAGKDQAVRESMKESAPLFRTANQVMGVSNTPAMADNSSSSGSNAYAGTSTYSDSGGSESGSSNNSSGRRYQSRHGRYQSKGSSGGVGADEFIAEEVDLTKDSKSRSSASTKRAPASNQNDTRAYVPASQEGTSSSRGPASETDEISKGRRSRPAAISGGADNFVPSPSGGGSSINLGSSSGGPSGNGSGVGTASSPRNPAKAATQTRAPASVVKGSPAQKQMMSDIVDSNYDETIRRIRNDKQFQDNLSNNDIKIIDTYGGAWGASDGSVVYQATGNRFIRQR